MNQANGLHDFAERSRAKAQSPELAALKEENAKLRQQQASTSREVNELRSELQRSMLQMMSSPRHTAEAPKVAITLPPEITLSDKTIGPQFHAMLETALTAFRETFIEAVKSIKVEVVMGPNNFAPVYEPKIEPTPIVVQHRTRYIAPPNPPSEITLKMPAREKRRQKIKYRKGKDGEEYPDEIEES